MRYIIETTDEGNIQSVWNTINSLKERGLITVVEKGDPVEEMKETLRKVARSMELLQKVGIDTELMVAYIKRKNPSISISAIKQTLESEHAFFSKLGIKLK